MRQLTDAEKLTAQAVFLEWLKPEHNGATARDALVFGYIAALDHAQSQLDAIQTIIEMLKAKCPGCNLAGSPGVTVKTNFDAARHYWGKEKVPCRWCEAVKAFELLGLQAQADNSQNADKNLTKNETVQPLQIGNNVRILEDGETGQIVAVKRGGMIEVETQTGYAFLSADQVEVINE